MIDQQFSTTELGASTEYVIVHSDSLTVDDPAYQAFVTQLQGTLAAKTDLIAAPPSTYYDALASVARRGGRVSYPRTSTTR